MSNAKRDAQQKIRDQRQELSANLGDGPGLCQLQFSGDWYKALSNGNNRNPWLSKRRQIAEIELRQSQRKSNASEPEKYEQIGFFGEGE